MKCISDPIQWEWNEMYQNLVTDIIRAHEIMSGLEILIERVDPEYQKTLEIEKQELLEKMKKRDELFYKKAYQHFSLLF